MCEIHAANSSTAMDITNKLLVSWPKVWDISWMLDADIIITTFFFLSAILSWAYWCCRKKLAYHPMRNMCNLYSCPFLHCQITSCTSSRSIVWALVLDTPFCVLQNFLSCLWKWMFNFVNYEFWWHYLSKSRKKESLSKIPF